MFTSDVGTKIKVIFPNYMMSCAKIQIDNVVMFMRVPNTN
jgi:hypothetical protein